MSTKYIINLLKSDKRPSQNLLQKLNKSIPQTLQKRIIMYANGDKRISKAKLIRDLTSAQQQKRIGGSPPNVSPIFLFGLPSPGEQSPQSPPVNVYKFAPPNPGSPMANLARLGALSFKYRSLAAESEKTFTNISKTIVLEQIIGSGSFADVYKIKGNKDICFKLFRSEKAAADAKECIGNFLLKCGDFIHNTTFQPHQTINEIWYENTSEDQSGYVVKLMSQNLSELYKSKADPNPTIEQTFQILKSPKNFIHGDIKLDNILMNETGVKIHDFDSVYVIGDLPYTKQISMTPLCAHPMFLAYSTCILKATDQLNLFEQLSLIKNQLWDRWTQIVTLATMSCTGANLTVIKTIIEKLKQLYVMFNFEIHNEHMIQKFDLYSFGASLIVFGCTYNMDHITKSGEEIITSIYRQSGGLEVRSPLDLKRRRILAEQPSYVKQVVAKQTNIVLSPSEANSLYKILSQKMYIVSDSKADEEDYKWDPEFAAHYDKLFA